MGHHYVPQYYLRGFTQDDRLWVYDKTASTPFRSTPKSVANENKLHSDEVEAFLASQIEDPTKAAISKIRAKEPISQQERHTLARYILILWKRNPQRRQHSLQRVPELAEETRGRIMKQLDDFEAANPAEAQKVSDLRKRVDAYIQKQKDSPSPDIWSESLAHDSGPSAAVTALLSMKWVFLYSDKQQFITGDNPVFLLNGIAKPDAELSIPISSTVTLWASRTDFIDGAFYTTTPAFVREINRRTAFNATRFVYSAKNEAWILPFVKKGRWQLNRLRP
jgi:hypothetical protein